MFKLSDIPNTFTWKVSFQMPMEGRQKEAHFMGRFKLLPVDEATALLAELQESEESADALLAEFFLGWDDGELKDENGDNLPSTDANIQKVLNIPFIRSAVLEAYVKASAGKKVIRKN